MGAFASGAVPGGSDPGALSDAASGSGNRREVGAEDCEGAAVWRIKLWRFEKNGRCAETCLVFYHLRGKNDVSGKNRGRLYYEEFAECEREASVRFGTLSSVEFV